MLNVNQWKCRTHVEQISMSEDVYLCKYAGLLLQAEWPRPITLQAVSLTGSRKPNVWAPETKYKSIFKKNKKTQLFIIWQQLPRVFTTSQGPGVNVSGCILYPLCTFNPIQLDVLLKVQGSFSLGENCWTVRQLEKNKTNYSCYFNKLKWRNQIFIHFWGKTTIMNPSLSCSLDMLVLVSPGMM